MGARWRARMIARRVVRVGTAARPPPRRAGLRLSQRSLCNDKRSRRILALSICLICLLSDSQLSHFEWKRLRTKVLEKARRAAVDGLSQ